MNFPTQKCRVEHNQNDMALRFLWLCNVLQVCICNGDNILKNLNLLQLVIGLTEESNCSFVTSLQKRVTMPTSGDSIRCVEILFHETIDITRFSL
jgi:hypothetical protein